MKRTRGFAVVTRWQGKGVALPRRQTARSAGYDLEAAEGVTIAPGETVMVATGVKAYMQPDEVLMIYNRSGLATKRRLTLANTVGVIDADYYDAPETEGEIFIPLYNYGEETQQIAKGERVAQGIFTRYLTADGDAPGLGIARSGGFGSTGRQ